MVRYHPRGNSNDANHHTDHPTPGDSRPTSQGREGVGMGADRRWHVLRYFDGEERDTTTDAKGLRGFSVFASGFQFEDGRIDDGTDPAFSSTGPCVYIGQICNDGARMQGDPLTADAARRLADLLATAADEVDGWATR